MLKRQFPVIIMFTLIVAASPFYASQVNATVYVSMEHPVVSTWPDDADGDIAPTTTITGAATNLNTPYSIDVYGGFMYVANQSGSQGVTVYPIDADGDVAPSRQIAGSLTNLGGGTEGIDVDGSWIYVTSSSRIVIFPIDADGDVAPARVITGAATTLSSPRKIEVDSNWIYVADVSDNSIKVFPKAADGDTAPTRVIVGANTLLSGHYAIAINSNWIYAANYGIAGAPPHNVLVFPIGANGNVAPTRRIQGAATDLDQPYGIAVDSSWIYVANYNGQSVLVFPTDADGDVAPTRTIAGPATPFNGWPSGIAVYSAAAAGAPIPTMNQWGMSIFIILTALVSFHFLRRRSAAA